MSRPVRRLLTVLTFALIGSLFFASTATAAMMMWNLDFASNRWGVVAAKGRVLGPNGKPIWAEYDADGNVVREIGEAHGEPLENAIVISGYAYRTYEEAFRAVQNQYSGAMEVLSKKAYGERVFTGPDGKELAKPPLAFGTNSVVVRDEKSVFGTVNLVLLESILDLNRLEQLPDTVQSVLLSAKGAVIDTSALNIGYRTAFYTPKGSTEHEVENGWVAGRDDLNGVNMDEDRLWGPIKGVEIGGGVDTTVSRQDGRFRVHRSCGCDVWTYVTAKLRYNILDPQDKFPGHYIMTQEWVPDCWWVPECLPGAGPPMTGGGSLAGVMMYMNWLDNCMLAAPYGMGYASASTIQYSYTAKIKFPIDVVMVSGAIRLRNPAGGDNILPADDTVYAYDAPSYQPTSPAPGTARLPDSPADFAERGLLETISQEDLQDTDLYIFRMSNDQLIMAREGLADDETLPYFAGGIEQDEDVIRFNLLMRGPNSDRDLSVRKMQASRPVWLFENYQKATGVNPELFGRKADHLRIGERVKVVAVNRKTGYIGTGIGSYGEPVAMTVDADGNLVQAEADVQTEKVAQMFISDIYMQPPNIKIRAERNFKVNNGLTKGTVYEKIIGFEGSGLSSDEYVAISSEWYDQDGSPLPENLHGYTGRLAKVVAENELGSFIDNFAIKPGRHLQLVQLPQKKIDNHHYYLHISGEPITGNPDFSETGAAPDGALQYRPAHYVPVKVPVYDEAATLDPSHPVYRWVYRPEMQFSVFDLSIAPAPGAPAVPDKCVLPYSYENDISFMFTLLQDELPMLDPFGPDRVLVFGWGDIETAVEMKDLDDDPVKVQMGAQGQVIVEDIENLKNLDAYDYLTVRLYQNGDDPNVLWEYATTVIDIKVENPFHSGCRIKRGETLTLLGVTHPAGRAVRWNIVEELTTPGVRVRLDPMDTTNPSKCRVVPEEDTASGYVWVRATDAEHPHIYMEKAIQVGCEECEVCKKISGASIKVASIEARFGLGQTAGGLPAGDLFLIAKQPTVELGTPRALRFSSLVDDVQARVENGKGLRQVLAPQGLADIVTLSDYAYEIRFYEPGAVSGSQDGLYTVAAGAQPFATWRIENLDASADTCNNLAVTEIRDGNSTANTYSWDAAASTWILSKGNGLEVTTHAEQIDAAAGDRIVTVQIKDGAGQIGSTVRTTWHSFDFGQAMTRQVVDPDGLALTTEQTYYDSAALTGSYGRVASRIDPDGSWAKYHYDTQGRLTSEESGWLDIGAGSGAGAARLISYDYTPVDPGDTQLGKDKYNPRTVTEQIAGTVVAKTYYAYLTDADGNRVQVTERCATPAAAYGDSANLRSVQTYYPSDGIEQGRIKSSQSPDGRLETYTYEAGAWDGSQFIAGAGKAQRTTAVQGTVGQPEGIAGKTTATVTIADATGNTVRSETQVYNGGYETVSWTSYTYDSQGHQTGTLNSDGTTTASIWSCCGKESDTDAAGIQTSYSYDDLKRVQTATRHLASGDITTDYTYDAAGRTLTQTVTAGALTMGTASTYDSAGRLKTSTDAASRTTIYDYSADGRTTTVTRPGGITEITTRFLDGKTKSVTGTGAVAQYYSYGVNPDGSRWSRVATSAADSPAYQLTTTDLLGRTLSTEQPGAGGPVTTAQYYDAAGRLARTTATGQADTLYVYDELGNPTRSGLDIDANGVLETASADRIGDTDTNYTQIDGAWWQQTTQKVYAAAGDATATTAAIQRQRITGLGGGLVAETVAVDIHGNATVSRTTVNPAAQRRTQTVDYPDSTIDAQSVTVGGLLVSSTTKSGLTTTFGYDALGRRTGVTDPRTGTATTHYDTQGQVDWVEDSAAHRTEFAYDPDTGRKTGQTDALGKVTRFAYNDRGQVTHTWGEVPYPVQYQYDAYGRMSAMTTYRTDEGFAADSFPASATGDTTAWHYDEATGQLTAKEYADGSQVTYTYTAAGRLETRTWARQDGGQPLVTTYTYDPATGELKTIDYSDATPDIAFTYDRLGRQSQIDDAVGTHTFAYNAALQLDSETVTGLYDATLSRTYDTAVPGRAAGFNLGAGYSVAYGYDAATGRFRSVAWNAAGKSDTATYGYLDSSDLLEQVTTTAGRQTTYAYEADRNLKTSVRNDFNGATVSQYDYVYDAVGRRTSAANTGSAFGQAAFDAYNYNDRSELIASDRYLGTDIFDTSSPVTDRQRGYLYDPIGNRTEADAAGTSTSYTANALNQYSTVGASSPAYDADGNMTTTPDGMAYTFNAENRLIAAQPQSPADGDTRAEFVYDYMGRRVQKVVYGYSSGAWAQQKEILFVYDGWNLVKETTTPDGGSSVDRYYVWGLDLSQSQQGAGGVGGLLATIDGSLTYQYLYDANGNVGQLVDAADGTIAARYEYDPYGNLTDLGGAYVDANAYRFSTKFFDGETSLYYYGYRYYSAEWGRWINRDAIGENGGMNLYAFISNGSINSIDNFGLWKLVPGSSHVWEAEKGDTLSTLASKPMYGGDAKNWPCLWPVSGTADHGYPNNIWPCDKYDASNLSTPSPSAVSLEIIADTNLAGVGGDYNLIFPTAVVLPGSQVANEIKSVSNEGRTPISSFVLAGHGGVGGTVGTVTSYFSVSNLTALNQSPSFSRANQKKGPLRCWFTRDAEARLSGCSSQGEANQFATNALRIGATAFGTTGTIGTGMIAGTPTIFWNPLSTPAGAHIGWGHQGNYYTSPIWVTFNGSL